MPEGTEVYLEDAHTNTFTLLTTTEYTFTANSAISGTGRFFLRIGSSPLSTVEQNSKNLLMFSSGPTLFVNGQLLADTNVSIYDLQGRLVLNSSFKEGTDRNTIDASSLSVGIYVAKLSNGTQELTKKVIFK